MLQHVFNEDVGLLTSATPCGVMLGCKACSLRQHACSWSVLGMNFISKFRLGTTVNIATLDLVSVSGMGFVARSMSFFSFLSSIQTGEGMSNKALVIDSIVQASARQLLPLGFFLTQPSENVGIEQKEVQLISDVKRLINKIRTFPPP